MDFKEILNAKMPLQEKADKIFGLHNSPAKEIFFKLRLRQGGIEPAVELLGLDRQYKAYQIKIDQAIEDDDDKKIVSLLQKFRSKLITQLCLKFKI